MGSNKLRLQALYLNDDEPLALADAGPAHELGRCEQQPGFAIVLWSEILQHIVGPQAWIAPEQGHGRIKAEAAFLQRGTGQELDQTTQSGMRRPRQGRKRRTRQQRHLHCCKFRGSQVRQRSRCCRRHPDHDDERMQVLQDRIRRYHVQRDSAQSRHLAQTRWLEQWQERRASKVEHTRYIEGQPERADSHRT